METDVWLQWVEGANEMKSISVLYDDIEVLGGYF